MSYETRPRTTFVCRECERECKNEFYARDLQNAKICDDCANAWSLREAETAPKVYAYLTKKKGVLNPRLKCEEFAVTNWVGFPVAMAWAVWEASAGHCGKQTYVFAVTPGGRYLSGRGPGVGVYCTLRPVKRWPRDIVRPSKYPEAALA